MRSLRGNEILNITVDIGNGKHDRVVVHEFDDPCILAKDFSAKHRLTQKIEVALTRNISELLKDIAKDQVLMSSTFSSRPEVDTSSCSNAGEKLYLKGLKHKEQVEANKQMLKMRIEREISETTSFKPVINKKSRELAKNVHSRSDFRLATPQIEAEECTFTPKINEKSMKMVATSSNRVLELYEDAEQRRKRLHGLNIDARKYEFPFKPSVKPNGRPSDPEELVQRLLTSKSNYYQHLEELKKKQEISTDPETGQELFKPYIGKSSQYLEHRENVWESLYQCPKKPSEPPEEYPYAPVNLDSKARSDKLLLKIKIDRFSDVFQQLNPDVNGNIFFKNIDVSAVDPVILKIIRPLLAELEELDQPLNFEEFVESMDNLLRTLNTTEKDVFFTKPRKIKTEESESSIKRYGSAAEIGKLYQRHVEKKNETSAKMDIEREKKKILELEGCTFHPKTTKYPIQIFK